MFEATCEPVPAHIPERPPPTKPFSEALVRKLALLHLGSPEVLRRRLNDLIKTQTYKDAVIVWTSNVARAKTGRVSLGELIKVGWKESAARRNIANGPNAPVDSLDFYQLLLDCVGRSSLAMYYLAMGHRRRSEMKQITATFRQTTAMFRQGSVARHDATTPRTTPTTPTEL